MSLFNQIKQDQLAARKVHNSLAAALLTTLIGEAAAIGKNNGNREVTDEEVVALVKKFIKGMNDTLGYLGDTNPDATHTMIIEKGIISEYLPKQMNEATLTEVLAELVTETGPNLGKLMGLLKARYAGQYDGSMASTIAKTVV